MHELSIAQSVVDAVVDKLPDADVTEICLTVGKLSGIEPDALRFCFDLVTAGTTMDGAALDINEPPGEAHCKSCDATFGLDNLIMLCQCGSADVHVISGDQLLIRAVRVARAA